MKDLNIRVGQKWVRRDGVVVTIVHDDGKASRRPFLSDNGHWYYRDGTLPVGDGQFYTFELVELFRDVESEKDMKIIDMEDPIEIRDRILEIDALTCSIQQEREVLMKILAQMGFALLDTNFNVQTQGVA